MDKSGKLIQKKKFIGRVWIADHIILVKTLSD